MKRIFIYCRIYPCSKIILLVPLWLALFVYAALLGLTGCQSNPYIDRLNHDLSPSTCFDMERSIQCTLKELEYSNEICSDIIHMVSAWKDTQQRSLLGLWKEALHNARTDAQTQTITEKKLAKIEADIARRLVRYIQTHIPYHESYYNLSDVAHYQKAQCLGYTQLYYVLASAMGLSVIPINVIEPVAWDGFSSERGHVSCLVQLSDNTVMMMDVVPQGFISFPFRFEHVYDTDGHYMTLKDQNNPLGLFRKIQCLDHTGLVAFFYNNYGSELALSGQMQNAVHQFTQAIERYPKLAEAWSNRAAVLYQLGNYDKAMQDTLQTLNLNPHMAEAFNTRAVLYTQLHQYEQALVDFDTAIKLNPRFTKAYRNRGHLNVELEEYQQAIYDYNRAIKLSPHHALTYYTRGNAYKKIKQYQKAIKSFSLAIRFNPTLQRAYVNRGFIYALLGQERNARTDLNTALVLNPSLNPYVADISNRFNLGINLAASVTSSPTVSSKIITQNTDILTENNSQDLSHQ